MPLPFNQNQMQRNARRIVKKAQRSRGPQTGARWAEIHWGLVYSSPASTAFGTVTFPTVKVYIDGTGSSGTALGNSIAQNPEPMAVRYVSGASFTAGHRCLLLRIRGDSRAGGNWIALGTLEGD
jgi:hypothetical protein